MIKGVVASSRASGISIAICGEMAGESIYLPILIGLGLNELSMNALSILRVKKILREMSYQECRDITEKALSFSTATEIHDFVFSRMRERFPHIFGQ
jgi:phosphotransferase system enzyme I (PtsI)